MLFEEMAELIRAAEIQFVSNVLHRSGGKLKVTPRFRNQLSVNDLLRPHPTATSAYLTQLSGRDPQFFCKRRHLMRTFIFFRY